MIDYEQAFKSYLADWMKKNGLGVNQYQVVDDHLSEIYDEWLTTPFDAFGDKTPAAFFDDLDNPFSIVKLFKKYIDNDITVPGPLLSHMVTRKVGVYPVILADLEKAVNNARNNDKLLTLIVELIDEMGETHPMDAYIAMVKQTQNLLNCTEAMIDVLKTKARDIKPKIIEAYLSTEHEYGKDSFLDVMSEMMDDEDAYKHIFENFVYEPSKCGMYAHMLSKLGNTACIEALEERLSDPNINYFNFCRVKEALEELGAETTVQRDFSGDADYEYLAHLTDENDSEDLQQEEDYNE